MADYVCAYCPLGGNGEPVILDGHPAHPACAEACEGLDLPAIRATITDLHLADQPEEA